MIHKITFDEAQTITSARFWEGDEIEISPERKEIDLSMIVGTNIPMRFGDDYVSNDSRQGHLIFAESYQSRKEYLTYAGMQWPKCQFDTSENNWVSWGKHIPWYTGKCPIPDGVRFSVIYRNEGIQPKCCALAWRIDESTAWQDTGGGWDVIAFRVTGLANGWTYPWEHHEI